MRVIDGPGLSGATARVPELACRPPDVVPGPVWSCAHGPGSTELIVVEDGVPRRTIELLKFDEVLATFATDA